MLRYTTPQRLGRRSTIEVAGSCRQCVRSAAARFVQSRFMLYEDGRGTHFPARFRHFSGRESLMKLALVTIVTANLEPMRTFYQQVLQIEPQSTVATMSNFLWRPVPSPYGASPSVRST